MIGMESGEVKKQQTHQQRKRAENKTNWIFSQIQYFLFNLLRASLRWQNLCRRVSLLACIKFIFAPLRNDSFGSVRENATPSRSAYSWTPFRWILLSIYFSEFFPLGKVYFQLLLRFSSSQMYQTSTKINIFQALADLSLSGGMRKLSIGIDFNRSFRDIEAGNNCDLGTKVPLHSRNNVVSGGKTIHYKSMCDGSYWHPKLSFQEIRKSTAFSLIRFLRKFLDFREDKADELLLKCRVRLNLLYFFSEVNVHNERWCVKRGSCCSPLTQKWNHWNTHLESL